MEAEASTGGGGGPYILVDVGAAQAYVDALRNLSASVNEGADVFGKQLNPVTESWQGVFRDRFDGLAAGYLSEAAGIAASLATLAQEIAEATEEAVLYNNAVTKAQAQHQPLPPKPASFAKGK